jgi:FixJ family two-component response regulator
MSERSKSIPVYVVDDDPMLCRAIARLLSSAGHSVMTFHSPAAFLSRRPLPAEGVLILDVRMPSSTGPELQAQLVAEKSSLAIYFMSAVDDAATRERVIDAGALGWFTKPIDGDALLSALDSAPRDPQSR